MPLIRWILIGVLLASTARAGDLILPQQILDSLDDSDAAVRVDAVGNLARMHRVVPGPIGLLRRAAHDSSSDVRLAAIEAAGAIGSRDALAAVADAIHPDWNDVAAGRIVDALDIPTLRPDWKTADPFEIADAMQTLQTIATRRHRLDDLLQRPIPDPTRSVIDAGRKAFAAAGCDACHRVAGYGRAVGPDLRGIGGCYDNANLIRHIIDPSLDLHDVGRFELFLLDDGRVITGRAIASKDDQPGRIVIQTDLSDPNSIRSIEAQSVMRREASKLSPMPTGLLDQLTPTQVTELVAFLRSDGGRVSTPSGDHDH